MTSSQVMGRGRIECRICEMMDGSMPAENHKRQFQTSGAWRQVSGWSRDFTDLSERRLKDFTRWTGKRPSEMRFFFGLDGRVSASELALESYAGHGGFPGELIEDKVFAPGRQDAQGDGVGPGGRVGHEAFGL